MMNNKKTYKAKTKNGVLIFGELVKEKGKSYIIARGGVRTEVIKSSIREYTGYSDCNGRGIYERDKIKVIDRAEKRVWTTKVCSLDDLFEFGSLLYWFENEDVEVEVIGEYDETGKEEN